jgi:tetratricopeptide (TPR) repeat protein
MRSRVGGARPHLRLTLGLAAIGLAIGGFISWGYLTDLAAPRKDAGTLAYQRGQWAEAEEFARARLKAESGDPEAIRLLARASARLGRDSLALGLFDRLAPTAMTAEDKYLLGLALGRTRQIEQAKSAWESALAIDPNRAEVLEGLTQLFAREHRLDRAIELARRLAQQPVWTSRGNRLLGVLLAELNDPAGAADALNQALEQPDAGEDSPPEPTRFRKLLARMLLKMGRAPKAAESLRTVLATGPNSEASWLISRAFLQEGDWAKASEAVAASGTYRAEHPLEPEPGVYLGETRCARCHASVAKAMLGTRHTATIQYGEGLKNVPIADQPMPDPGDPKIVHLVSRVGDKITFESKIDDGLYRLVVDYAFGTTGRYLTMVGHDEQGNHRATRLSYHRNGADVGWDVSAGDQVHHKRREDYRGRPVDVAYGTIKCVACHSTNVRFGKQRTGPETADRGIGCERCHGPGGNHVAAVEAGLADLAIVNPSDAPGAASDNVCVECHNLNAASFELSTPREDPAWVRSPGKTLTWSRCYTESGGALRCLTCHEAHQPSKTVPTYYESKCLTCHSGTPAVDSASSIGREGASQLVCPINARADCLRCHMPKVPNALLHTELTDHFIRVRGERTTGKETPR